MGINTFIVSEGGGSEGLGFAIPEPTVKFVYEELKAHGRVRQTDIGVNAQTITPTLAVGLNLAQDWGVIISDVLPGGSAEKGGVQAGDILASIDGHEVESLPKYAAFMYMHPRGTPVQLEVLRKETRVKLSVAAEEVPSGLDSLVDLIDPQSGLIVSLGIFVFDLNQNVTRMLPELRSTSGVVVAALLDSEPAVAADLNAGDVIRAFNGKPLSPTAELRMQLDKLKVGDAAVLEVERHGVIKYVAFEME